MGAYYSPVVPPHGSSLESAHKRSYEMLLHVAKHRAVLFGITGYRCVFMLWKGPWWLGCM